MAVKSCYKQNILGRKDGKDITSYLYIVIIPLLGELKDDIVLFC